MLYTASSSLTGLFMQMGVTDYTAEDKSSMFSCADLRSDGGNHMGICLMERMNSGMQLNGQSLEATAQAQEKEQMGWGSEEPAATSCIHVYTLATWGRRKEGLSWPLDAGTPHISWT